MTKPNTRDPSEPRQTLPLGAAISQDTICPEPNMEAYDKWRAARRDLRASIELPGGGDFDLPETKAAQRREAAALETMLACRPQTLHDAQGLAHVAWEHLQPSMPEGSPEFEAAMCDPGLRLVLRLWQAAAGMNGLPQEI